MTKLAEIQDAILRLEAQDQQALRHWLDETVEESSEMAASGVDVRLRTRDGRRVIRVEELHRSEIPRWVSGSA